MNIMVTGGSGFIGSHVADALSDSGHKVFIFDIQKSPYLRNDQTMVTGDLMDQALLYNITRDMDVVYHFAGIADIDDCAKNPVETARINILGTVQLLEAAKRANIKRFVFASSAYVYSDLGFFYRTSKQACESYIENYSDLYGLKYTCLRYGSLYGPRADERNGVYRLIKQAVETGRIVYPGTGDEQREYVHVLDAAQSSVMVLKEDYENTHIVLTGTEKMCSGDLLKMLKEMFHGSIEIEFSPQMHTAHYKITPYNFSPKLGRKLVSNPHIDMGQGLLLNIAEVYEKVHLEKSSEMGVLVNGKDNDASTSNK